MRPFITSFILTVLSGCGQKPVSIVDLSASLRQVASLAAEVQLLITQHQAGKISLDFAQAHIAYLADDLTRAQQQLGKAAPMQELTPPHKNCLDQQRLLVEHLSRVQAAWDNPSALATLNDELTELRKRANQARASL